MSGSAGVSGAPAAIQRVSRSNSSAVMGLTLTLKVWLHGGICPVSIFLTIRLASGCPGTSAGPDFPPLSIAARDRKSRPPSFLWAPWQTVQCCSRDGRMSFSVSWATRGSLSASSRDGGSAGLYPPADRFDLRRREGRLFVGGHPAFVEHRKQQALRGFSGSDNRARIATAKDPLARGQIERRLVTLRPMTAAAMRDEERLHVGFESRRAIGCVGARPGTRGFARQHGQQRHREHDRTEQTSSGRLAGETAGGQTGGSHKLGCPSRNFRVRQFRARLIVAPFAPCFKPPATAARFAIDRSAAFFSLKRAPKKAPATTEKSKKQ